MDMNTIAPAQPVKAICNNLFSSGCFDADMSPMTELAANMELSKVKIPRRRLTLSSESESSKGLSFEPGVNSPLSQCPDSPIDSPIIEYIRSKKKMDMRRKCASRSFSSPIMQRKPLNPLTLFGSASSFKPVSVENVEENHSDLSICEMADSFPDMAEDFLVKKSYARCRSAPTVNMETGSGMFRGESYEDDGFFEGLEQVAANNMSPSCPLTFSALIDNSIVQSKVQHTEEDKENQQPYKMTSSNAFEKNTVSSLKKRSLSCSSKRDSPCTGSSPSPMCTKKQKMRGGRSFSFYDGNPALRPIQLLCPTQQPKSPRVLQRSQSFDSHNVKSPSVDITSLFDMDDKNLIGDKSKKYLLPTTRCKHPDLKAITPETLTKLMDNEYDDVEEFIIVDARYPYEFDGGHIKGAVSIHEKSGMIDYFLKNVRPPTDKRRIIVFHCEFSSKRGPTMCRFLRNKDRDIHQNLYPKLYYPEMYLLEGGYKEFYEKKKEYCEPQGYREMVDVDYQKELRLFNKRSKSWSEDNSLRSRTGLRC